MISVHDHVTEYDVYFENRTVHASQTGVLPALLTIGSSGRSSTCHVNEIMTNGASEVLRKVSGASSNQNLWFWQKRSETWLDTSARLPSDLYFAHYRRPPQADDSVTGEKSWVPRYNLSKPLCTHPHTPHVYPHAGA